MSKNKSNICKHTKKFDETTSMAILQRSLTFLEWCRSAPYPFVGTSQYIKSPIRTFPCSDKMKKHFFGSPQNHSCKSYWKLDMHNSIKYEAKIRKFAFLEPKTLAHFP
jgi:hypothetical protein